MRQEQLFTKSLLDSLPGIFYTSTPTPTLQLVLWNKQHESLLGFETGEMAGRHVTAWHVPQAMDAVSAAIKEVMEKGQSSIEAPLPVDMTGLAQAVVDECAAQAPGRQFQFKMQPLPPGQGDRAMLRQVLVNLCSNAIKYTRSRTVAEIEIGGRVEGDDTLYYVKDNGVGFDMKYAEKLFGVFQRLHGEAEFEGTGVGLALARRVIHRHGGRIWAEAKLNEGATFYFTMPIRKD